MLAEALAEGFNERLVPADQIRPVQQLEPLPRITWSNHLSPESNAIALKLEEQARKGPPADPRLRDSWREVYEDVVWSVANLGEFVWMP